MEIKSPNKRTERILKLQRKLRGIPLSDFYTNDISALADLLTMC
jgi:hypothetical protein